MNIKLLTLLPVFLLQSNLSPHSVYDFIKKVPFDDHGWFPSSNQEMLGKIIQQKKPKIVIEVGSWLGASTRYIAQTIPQGSIVYAVDTWEGSPDEPGHMNDARVKHKKLFHIFLSNVAQAELVHKIIPIRMTSMEACSAFTGQADLIYIDAAHDEESVYMDIINWSKKLAPGGVICGDDWNVWPSVTAAVKRAAYDLKKEVKSYGNFWQFN